MTLLEPSTYPLSWSHSGASVMCCVFRFSRDVEAWGLGFGVVGLWPKDWSLS